MVGKGIRGGICHAIHRYAKANNKYMKNYDTNKEFSFIEYLDGSNLYGWAMSKKVHTNGSRWRKDVYNFTTEFIENYDEESDIEYILEVDINYPRHLHSYHSDLPFFLEKMIINKCKKLIFTVYDKRFYVTNIYMVQLAIKNELIPKKYIE